jgi:hypothetical protein
MDKEATHEKRPLSPAQLVLLEALKGSYNKLLKQKGQTRINGKVLSARSQQAARQVVFAAFRALYDLGYQIRDVSGVGTRYVALIRHWYSSGKSVKTI